MYMDSKVLDIIKQLAYKEYAMDVINSCKTLEHFDGACNYINNYYKLTEDNVGHHELTSHLNIKRIHSLYPEY